MTEDDFPDVPEPDINLFFTIWTYGHSWHHNPNNRVSIKINNEILEMFSPLPEP